MITLPSYSWSLMRRILYLVILIACFSVNDVEATQRASSKRPLVTFLELGSASCIPCRMMKPVMKDIAEHYQDKIEVVFYDIALPQNRQIAIEYRVRVMPTQVFLDADGKEFFRHEGYYPKDQIIKMLDKYYREIALSKE